VVTVIGVAGYDGQNAHVYETAVEMDWKALAHKVPPVESLYPDKGRKHLTLYIVGSGDAIQELGNTNSVTFRAARATMPTEIDALSQDRELVLSGLVILARGLLALQVARDPASVGYPLTVASVPKGGRISMQTYQK
jgi:hypothetical protein